MKTILSKITILLLAIVPLCTSCFSTKTITPTKRVYAGSQYDYFQGRSENEILRSLSAPTRQLSDGANGKILVYEQVAYVTDSRTTSSSSAYAQSSSAAVSGYYSAAAAGSAAAKSYGASNTRTVSTEDKAYVNFFINPQGKCYQVKASEHYNTYETKYGTPYKQKCMKRSSWWLVVLPPWAVSAAIIGIVKAASGCPYCDEVY